MFATASHTILGDKGLAAWRHKGKALGDALAGHHSPQPQNQPQPSKPSTPNPEVDAVDVPTTAGPPSPVVPTTPTNCHIKLYLFFHDVCNNLARTFSNKSKMTEGEDIELAGWVDFAAQGTS